MRLAGLLIAIVAVLWGVVSRARGRASRGEALVLVGLGLGLGVLSVFPVVAKPLATIFGVQSSLTGALVLVSIALVFGLAIERLRRKHLEERFGDLVRRLALGDLLGDVADLGEPSLAVVIPAFNEEDAIEGVLGDLPTELAGMRVEPIVVVDGGSDQTESVVRRAGYLVTAHPVNRGQGDALRTGFALALHRGAEVVMTMDADGQHRPDEMIELVKPIVAGEADYVQGSRYLGQYDDAGGARDVGIRVLTRFVNLLSHAGISDCTNGFRAVRGSALARLHLEEDRFSAPELIIESSRRGLRIREVPVHIRTRSHGESKKPRRLGYPVSFVRAALRAWLR